MIVFLFFGNPCQFLLFTEQYITFRFAFSAKSFVYYLILQQQNSSTYIFQNPGMSTEFLSLISCLKQKIHHSSIILSYLVALYMFLVNFLFLNHFNIFLLILLYPILLNSKPILISPCTTLDQAHHITLEKRHSPCLPGADSPVREIDETYFFHLANICYSLTL